MSPDKNRINELRGRRLKLAQISERKRLRSAYGQHLVSVIAEATKRPLILDDFDVNAHLPMRFEWSNSIDSAPGLVAAYIAKSSAIELLTCFREKIGLISGLICFHDKQYLGLARINLIEPTSLFSISEKAEDSVIFYTDAPSGAMLMDCYPNPMRRPFSIVVQGHELIETLALCFS